MLADNTKILKKNIVPIASVSDRLENKIYTWTLVTNNKYPSSVNQEEEKREIKVFKTIEVLKSALINSHSKSK